MALRSFLSEEGRRIHSHHSENLGAQIVLWDIQHKRWVPSETSEGRWRRITPAETIEFNNRGRLYLRNVARNQARQTRLVAGKIAATLDVEQAFSSSSVGAVPTLTGQNYTTSIYGSVLAALGSSSSTATSTSSGGSTSRMYTKAIGGYAGRWY
jgi:hypothetical protein